MIAFRILDILEQERSNSSVLLQQFLSKVPKAADRNLITDLVLGCLRWKGRLLFWLQSFSNRPLEKIDRQIRIVLQMGIYQLYFTKIPQHAAIYETVAICKKIKMTSAASFANGLLRAIQSRLGDMPEPESHNPLLRLSVVYSHPEWLVDRWLNRFGEEETERLLAVNVSIPPLYIRTNELVIDSENVIRKLKAEGIDIISSNRNPAILEVLSGAPQMSNSFEDGEFYIQDAAMERLGESIAPASGSKILEVAAAPGGKTFQLAVRMKGKGTILSVDSEIDRMKLWVRSMNRLKIHCAVPVVADARQLPLFSLFDHVVLDAPCSGMGVIRRHPEIKWWRKPNDFAAFQTLQLQILNSCAKYVRSQGDLVYSVCSFEPEETTDVVRIFSETHSDFRFIDTTFLYPHRDGTDGFFIAKWNRDGSGKA